MTRAAAAMTSGRRRARVPRLRERFHRILRRRRQLLHLQRRRCRNRRLPARRPKASQTIRSSEACRSKLSPPWSARTRRARRRTRIHSIVSAMRTSASSSRLFPILRRHLLAREASLLKTTTGRSSSPAGMRMTMKMRNRRVGARSSWLRFCSAQWVHHGRSRVLGKRTRRPHHLLRVLRALRHRRLLPHHHHLVMHPEPLHRHPRRCRLRQVVHRQIGAACWDRSRLARG